MFVIVRSATYASLFIGLVFLYLPAQILASAGVVKPAAMAVQGAAMAIGAIGAIAALWSIATFATAGRGTPAPFDPPRILVLGGPYRFVRNPMYIGAGLVLAGTALRYGKLALWAYAAGFLVVSHLFVVAFEEPTLRRMFGAAYEDYCARVRRWLPGRARP